MAAETKGHGTRPTLVERFVVLALAQSLQVGAVWNRFLAAEAPAVDPV